MRVPRKSNLAHPPQGLRQVTALGEQELRLCTGGVEDGLIGPELNHNGANPRRFVKQPHVAKPQVVKGPGDQDGAHAQLLAAPVRTCTLKDPGTGSSLTT